MGLDYETYGNRLRQKLNQHSLTCNYSDSGSDNDEVAGDREKNRACRQPGSAYRQPGYQDFKPPGYFDHQGNEIVRVGESNLSRIQRKNLGEAHSGATQRHPDAPQRRPNAPQRHPDAPQRHPNAHRFQM